MTDANDAHKIDVFSMPEGAFESNCLAIFRWQYEHNLVYAEYCKLLHRRPDAVSRLSDIPFLPISFFKNKKVVTTKFEPELVFESSKTTGEVASRHFIKDASLYERSYLQGFQAVYGDVQQYCIIGLLPSYLERGNSSLVHMVKDLIERSQHPASGFYLNDFKSLHLLLQQNEKKRQPTLLFGVTFALLDFGSEYPLPLSHTTIIETGGMKGRKKELTRDEVHVELSDKFKTNSIHSEYGMTELLSQAYATSKGMFHCPPWMRMLVRDPDDPFKVNTNDGLIKPLNGLGNIIDLANTYSCAFIATDDVVKLYANNAFEILGRADNSDIRGCSLMASVI